MLKPLEQSDSSACWFTWLPPASSSFHWNVGPPESTLAFVDFHFFSFGNLTAIKSCTGGGLRHRLVARLAARQANNKNMISLGHNLSLRDRPTSESDDQMGLQSLFFSWIPRHQGPKGLVPDTTCVFTWKWIIIVGKAPCPSRRGKLTKKSGEMS